MCAGVTCPSANVYDVNHSGLAKVSKALPGDPSAFGGMHAHLRARAATT